MQNLFIAGALAVLLPLTALAQSDVDVDVDYDPGARFGEYRTYAFVTDSEDTLAERNPERHAMVLDMLREYLDKNYREVDANPDLWVLYKVAVDEVVEMHTQYEYAYGDDWARFDSPGAGQERPTTKEYRYTRGTLVIDTWDAKTNTLIWRGVASDTIADNPRVTERRTRKAIKRIADQWKRIRQQELAAP